MLRVRITVGTVHAAESPYRIRPINCELLAMLEEVMLAAQRMPVRGPSIRAKLHALLSAPSPAGVDGLEVVGVRVTSDGFGSYIADSAMGMPATFPGEVREPLCRLSSASSIIIGLQEKIERLQFSLEVAKTDELSAAVYAETESIKHSLWDAEKERDQQAQRIGELEAALEFACKALAQVTSSDGSGHADIAVSVLRMAGTKDADALHVVEAYKAGAKWRINAALSAGKEGE